MSGHRYPVLPPDGFNPDDYDAYLLSLYEGEPPLIVEETPEDFELNIIANNLSAAADDDVRATPP